MDEFQGLEQQYDERVIDIARVAKVVKAVDAFHIVSPDLATTTVTSALHRSSFGCARCDAQSFRARV